MKTLESKKNQYVQPEAEVIDVKPHNMICASDTEDWSRGMYFDEDE